MKRILPLLLLLLGHSLHATEPNHLASPPATFDPQAYRAAHAPPPNKALEKRNEEIIKNLPKPLPDEREAFLAAGAADGWGQFDDRGRVKTVFCGEASDADIKLFAALVAMESLHVGPDILQPFEGPLPKKPMVTDAGLAPLEKASKLRTLAFVNAEISDAGLQHIGQLTDLTSLLLVRCARVTGAGMARLERLNRLEYLNLSGSSVGDDGMRSIGGHGTLRLLRLGWPVRPRGLAELARLTSLEELWIDKSVGDDDLAAIGQLTSLGSLQCDDLRSVSDGGLRHITKMT